MQGGAALEQRFERRAQLHVDGYGGTAHGAAIPCVLRGGADVFGRRHRSRSRLRRHRARGSSGASWHRGRPLAVTFGGDFDTQHEHRKGFVNNDGALGDLRRDEDDTVSNYDVYAQARVGAGAALSLTGRRPHERVRFRFDDHYVTAQNPDDSGSRSSATRVRSSAPSGTPLNGLNLYASYGEGFETPTFAELAYRPGGTGPQLRPAAGDEPREESASRRWSAIAIGSTSRCSTSTRRTRSSSMPPLADARRTRTRARPAPRRGGRVGWRLPPAFTTHARAHLPARGVRRRLHDRVAAGAGACRATAAWRSVEAGVRGASRGLPGGGRLSMRRSRPNIRGKLYVNDRNTDAAPAYTVVNAADRLRAAQAVATCARVRARQQLLRSQLRRAR